MVVRVVVMVVVEVARRVLVPQVLQLPPRAQDQAPALPSELQAEAATSSTASAEKLSRRPRALLLLLFSLLLGSQRPRRRPLAPVHHLDRLLDGQVAGARRAAEVVGKDVGGDGGGEGRGCLAPSEELDLGAGPRVDLFFLWLGWGEE